jgi:hypothetical protein
MPVHVEEMTSEVIVFEGDLPLTDAQVDKLVQLVLKRLAEKEREAKNVREATALRRHVAPPSPIEE